MINKQAVWNAVRDAVFLVDGETGMILEANRAAEALCGRSVAELRSLHLAQLHATQSPEAEPQCDRDPLAPDLTEGSVLHRDGREIPVEISASRFRAPDGKQMLIGVYREAAERKVAREALRQSEERFRQVAESVGEFVWEVDATGLYIYANPVVEQILGYKPEEVVGKKYFYDFLVPETREEIKAAAFAAFGRREPFRAFLNWNVRKDGTRVALETTGTPVVDAGGALLGYRGADTDVTERMQTEDALRRSEQRFRSLFENATVGIYRTTPSGRIEMANPALVRMLGYDSFEALVARNLEETGFEPEYSRSDFRETLERQGDIQGLEATWTKQDGSSLFVRESARCIRDEAGAVRYYEGIVEDFSERRRIEDALRQSERKFAAAFRLGPAAMAIVDMEDDDRILDVNEVFEQASGYARVDLVGQTPHGLGLWPEAEGLSEVQRLYARDGRLRNFEIHFRKKDGEIRTGLLSAEPMEIDNRRCAITCTIDITERKQAEAALRESETRLAEAQRLAKVGSWEVDLRTGEARWSDESYRIFGLSMGEEPGFEAFLSRVHPKDRDKLLEGRAKTASSGGPVETEFRFIRPDGDVRFIRAIAVSMMDEGGVPRGLRGAAQDITQQVSAAEAVAESERRLSNAERIAHVGNWRWDIKSNRVFWSDELYRILGLPRDCAPGSQRFFQMVAPEDRERVTQWVTECIEGGGGESPLEFRIARPDGERRTVASVIETARDEDGSPASVSGTCQDITEAKRAQEESYSRQKLESLGTLASGIAHDFNNLLGAVLAQAELATVELASGSHPDEELQEIRNMAIRGSEIVRQLMMYAGKESDVPERVDVSTTVEEMLGFLKASISKHAVLAIDLGVDLPVVKARAAQLRQIVMNLVVNASDAIQNRDGVIRLSTGRVAVGRDMAGGQAEALSEGEYVQLEVSDTGRGIPPAVQAKMFDPFFTTKSAGRGLGLAVIHGIVRSLHGSIRVWSEVGKGSTFRILLPCGGPPAGAAAAPVAGIAPAEATARRATVLILEDEEALRLAVRKMLDKAGFEVLDTDNGTEAIELLRARAADIDLLLMDMTVPGRTPAEVLEEASKLRPDLKVILTSAYSEEMIMAGISSPLVHGFIRKPFQLAKLIDKLRSALSR